MKLFALELIPQVRTKLGLSVASRGVVISRFSLFRETRGHVRAFARRGAAAPTDKFRLLKVQMKVRWTVAGNVGTYLDFGRGTFLYCVRNYHTAPGRLHTYPAFSRSFTERPLSHLVNLGLVLRLRVKKLVYYGRRSWGRARGRSRELSF